MMEIRWIKITTDIFDDEKIKLIDSFPDRDAIIVIWFKLLTLAGKKNSNGLIFLSNKLAYTDEMLSTIFNRPLNTVRLAIKTFTDLDMIEVNNDEIIAIVNWEKHQNIEGLEKIREQNRIRKQKQRETLKLASKTASHVMSRDSHATDKKKIRLEEEENIRVYSRFLETWNQQKPLPTHSDEVVSKNWMKKHDIEVKLYSDDQIIKAIENYSTVISHPDKYYFSYKWNFWDFIMRGLDKFIDEIDPLNNFKKDMKEKKQRHSTEPDSGLGVEDYEGRSM